MSFAHPFRSLCVGGGILLLTILSASPSFSDEAVRVTASVWPLSSPPYVSAITPASSPVVLAHGNIQNFSVNISDTDSPTIAYTITPANGSLLKSSGNLTVTGGHAVLGFTYFAPSVKVGFTSITLTLNDLSGSAPVVRTIDLYVY